MNKIKQFFKQVDYRHYICIILSLFCFLLSIWCFPYAFLRIFESLKDLINSIAYYFSNLFGSGEIDLPTVTQYSTLSFEMPLNLPETWEEFKVIWNDYWELFVSEENLQLYLESFGDFLYKFSKYIVLFMPAIILLPLFVTQAWGSSSDSSNGIVQLFTSLSEL